MEIVLQWLDELDDLVFAGLSMLERLPRPPLKAAVTVAVGLNTLSLLAIA